MGIRRLIVVCSALLSVHSLSARAQEPAGPCSGGQGADQKSPLAGRWVQAVVRVVTTPPAASPSREDLLREEAELETRLNRLRLLYKAARGVYVSRAPVCVSGVAAMAVVAFSTENVGPFEEGASLSEEVWHSLVRPGGFGLGAVSMAAGLGSDAFDAFEWLSKGSVRGVALPVYETDLGPSTSLQAVRARNREALQVFQNGLSLARSGDSREGSLLGNELRESETCTDATVKIAKMRAALDYHEAELLLIQAELAR